MDTWVAFGITEVLPLPMSTGVLVYPISSFCRNRRSLVLDESLIFIQHILMDSMLQVTVFCKQRLPNHTIHVNVLGKVLVSRKVSGSVYVIPRV